MFILNWIELGFESNLKYSPENSNKSEDIFTFYLIIIELKIIVPKTQHRIGSQGQSYYKVYLHIF